MVRPFSLRDVFFVQNLDRDKVRFDLPAGWVHSRSSTHLALLAYFFRGGLGAETYVLKGREKATSLRGYAQVRRRRSRPEQDILCLAPSLDHDPDAALAWECLLHYACQSAGEQGIQRLYARVIGSAGEEEVLRGFDFHLYAHEDIFRLPAAASRPAAQVTEGVIRHRQAKDEWGLHQLYLECTPHGVQTAEGLISANSGMELGPAVPAASEEQFVLEAEGRICGYLRLLSGGEGCCLTLMASPEHEIRRRELLTWGIEALSRGRPRPIFCGVRQYDKGTQAILQEYGFEFLTTAALLAKTLAVRVREPVFRLVPALEKRVERAPTHTYEEYTAGKL